MKTWGWVIVLCLPVFVCAQEIPHTSTEGQDTVAAAFFRNRYHRSDLVYYLEALNDHTIAETTTYGQWWIPDRLSIAVEGLPCTANRFYIDGMRVDDRFQPGSTVYVPNMQRYNLVLNTLTSQWSFSQDQTATDYVQATYNFGQLGNGEPMAGTKCIFNITHRSPMESADTYKHVTARRHLKGAGTLDAAYTLHNKQGDAFRQHLYAAYGERLITRENQCGLITEDPLYNAPYYKVQADGLLPIHPTRAVSQLGYRLNFSGRTDAGSEYLYNYNEVYDLKNYTGTLYLKRQYLTTGLTWATNVSHHNDRCFSKNILDQDGENFFPWVADGKTHELSWAVNYEQPLLPWLRVYVDAYNSLLHFRPEEQTFSNEVYMQSMTADHPTPLYRYEWQSKAFTGGLLENAAGLRAHYDACRQVAINAHLDVTLDAMLLRNTYKVSPNIQAGFNVDLHPCKWFEMGVTLDYERMPYNADYLRFFSPDYMNGTIYYSGTNTLLGTTGGQYHSMQKHLPQTTYLELDIPIHFRFRSQRGLHEIVLQQSYKKYFNVWHTYFKGNATDYGYFQRQDNIDVFYFQPCETQYEVGIAQNFGSNWLMNSPYYFSQLTRYTFTGRKVMVSLSWQSMQAAGYCGLGNGVMSNSLGVLSETTANPNTSNVVHNQAGKYRGVGRLDLDKGYICRFYLGYNICKYIQTGVTIKWTDGKPFTDWHYFTDGGQVAILPEDSRGTNPTDGHFGKRHCAKYNIDWHVQGSWEVQGVPMRLNVECYNIWDFCHDLAEMGFVQDYETAHRASMIMDIPIGLLATFTVDITK
ncbi:MAG: hypothetical protein MJZ65_04920 [Paludibacteraceae bacterium]|nr:hypothetical protein [Paludibacteraceae bacterium]